MPGEVAPAVAAISTTMEITVSKFELLRELTATQGVVERKTTIPILSNYLFEAAGDRLTQKGCCSAPPSQFDCLRTSGSSFFADGPTQRWWEWRDRISRACRCFHRR